MPICETVNVKTSVWGSKKTPLSNDILKNPGFTARRTGRFIQAFGKQGRWPLLPSCRRLPFLIAAILDKEKLLVNELS